MLHLTCTPLYVLRMFETMPHYICNFCIHIIYRGEMYRAKPNMTMKKIEIAPGTILDVFVALHFSANCVIGGDQRELIDHVCRVVVFVV